VAGEKEKGEKGEEAEEGGTTRKSMVAPLSSLPPSSQVEVDAPAAAAVRAPPAHQQEQQQEQRRQL